MRRIGLIGGMSWESSIEYERIINEEVRRRLGGASSADLVIRSFNFASIEAMQAAGRWDDAAQVLAEAAADLERSGAEILILCTNTMHRLAHAIESATTVPLIHIADPTARAVVADGIGVVGLLGTRYTMEGAFYAGRLRDVHGLDVLVPDEAGRALVHAMIYDELVRGVVSPASRSAVLGVVTELIGRGAAGIIAGCTEMELLIGPDDVPVPLYPTARLHALAAVEASLAAGRSSGPSGSLTPEA